jgi:hypothetical protein
MDLNATPRREIWVSRLTTLLLFVASGGVAICFVKQMLGWFMFINSAMIIFLLPLAFFRFFWWRFNVWGELAAVVLGLPMSILVWFGLDFQDPARHPMWQGLGLLFGLSFVVSIVVTLLTPAETPETLATFYKRCQPPGFWGPVQARVGAVKRSVIETHLITNSILGILACFGLVIATNGVFVGAWLTAIGGATIAIVAGGWLVNRVFQPGTGGPSA